MIKEGSDFFQNAKFCPILVIYNSPDDQHVQFCMNSKFDAILQPVLLKKNEEKKTEMIIWVLDTTALWDNTRSF